jgi:hypothetical protein
MPIRISGVTTKIITAAAVLDRSVAYQGLALDLDGSVLGDRGLVAACCSVIIHLIRFETDDGVARLGRSDSADDHVPPVPFGTTVAPRYTYV